jgi:hypothetical protein
VKPNKRPTYPKDKNMTYAIKTKLTSTVAAAAIAVTSLGATPAQALTDEEALALVIGVAAFAALMNSGNAAPAPAPAPTPVTFSTGPITLKQTFTADFDHGAVAVPGADLWFQAVTPTQLYLKPRNGAKMAVGNRSNRGFAGCSAESFSGHRVPLAAVPVGSYVCMKTSAGRISQFRMNAILGGYNHRRLKLGYTTWQ